MDLGKQFLVDIAQQKVFGDTVDLGLGSLGVALIRMESRPVLQHKSVDHVAIGLNCLRGFMWCLRVVPAIGVVAPYIALVYYGVTRWPEAWIEEEGASPLS